MEVQLITDEMLEEPGTYILTSNEKLEKWGYGEWIEEPDVYEFEHKGFKCVISREIEGARRLFSGGESGFLNAFLRVLYGHPWWTAEGEIECEVYECLTYSSKDVRNEKWLGFSCRHEKDLVPSEYKEVMKNLIKVNNTIYAEGVKEKVYKNIAFVKEELIKFADQAFEAQSSSSSSSSSSE